MSHFYFVMLTNKQTREHQQKISFLSLLLSVPSTLSAGRRFNDDVARWTLCISFSFCCSADTFLSAHTHALSVTLAFRIIRHTRSHTIEYFRRNQFPILKMVLECWWPMGNDDFVSEILIAQRNTSLNNNSILFWLLLNLQVLQPHAIFIIRADLKVCITEFRTQTMKKDKKNVIVWRARSLVMCIALCTNDDRLT